MEGAERAFDTSKSPTLLGRLMTCNADHLQGFDAQVTTIGAGGKARMASE
jgi:hypothetical protein